ncbi:hypothetical protein BaRGS_00035224 [Batillaria attramentaria]|uniref:Uncharacterized protein n=1 Tax=Batillaria attramentaria TaxID=370345 RepID=A0ABD0JFE7_9CAEN
MIIIITKINPLTVANLSSPTSAHRRENFIRVAAPGLSGQGIQQSLFRHRTSERSCFPSSTLNLVLHSCSIDPQPTSTTQQKRSQAIFKIRKKL